MAVFLYLSVSCDGKRLCCSEIINVKVDIDINAIV